MVRLFALASCVFASSSVSVLATPEGLDTTLGPWQFRAPLPCDIVDKNSADSAVCVAAHSTTRAMYRRYKGPLYQITSSEGKTMDVYATDSGIAVGYSHKKFCSGKTCTISLIYDQSGNGNHLSIATAGGSYKFDDVGADAMADPLLLRNRLVYSVYVDSNPVGYRNDATKNVPTGDDPQTIYMVTSGTHYNDQCCFDYGNAGTDNLDGGPGTMDALYFGAANGGLNHGGAGKGPWIMSDLGDGLFGSDSTSSSEPSINYDFVTALVKSDRSGSEIEFAIKGGNAQEGDLETLWSGDRPYRYSTMDKQGAICLGIGGDNNVGGEGTFYEGAVIAGFTADSTDDALQANIVAMKYAQQTDMSCDCTVGLDHDGDTYQAYSDVESFADCCDYCTADADCECSVFATDVGGGTCMLKTNCGVTQEVGDNRIMCTKKVCTWWNCEE